jgi:hypothetical protein
MDIVLYRILLALGTVSIVLAFRLYCRADTSERPRPHGSGLRALSTDSPEDPERASTVDRR